MVPRKATSPDRLGTLPDLLQVPNGFSFEAEIPSLSNLGELTDKGRESTYALGERLRHLYVDQLKFMPPLISSADMMYIRATPISRALESVQQVFWGMYPLTARTASFPPPTIITRTPADEVLFPNESSCRRFAQLSRAFAQRTADRWNETDDMKYLNNLIAKWMPASSPQVAVDSHPRLSGIMDTINSTLAHGPETRLPKEFYDKKGREIIERIGVEEWFSGYVENREYRLLGIGALVGNMVERIVATIEGTALTVNEVGGENGRLGRGRGGETAVKFGLSGCHDTTLAAVLSSFGAFEGEMWPPYTSHIAMELFRDPKVAPPPSSGNKGPEGSTEKQAKASRPGWLASMLGLSTDPTKSSSDIPTLEDTPAPSGIARRPMPELSESEKSKLNGYYVRMRFNDRVVTVPGCKKSGKHLEGDESFCTLEAFKAIADDFLPRNWKQDCRKNMDEEAIKPVGQEEWAGYEPSL
jgi:acid phosphatase